MVDFSVFGRFCRQLSSTLKAGHTKAIYNQRMVGTRRYQVARVKDPALRVCPCCRTNDKTADHVFQCSENPGRQESIRIFRKAMSPTRPDPTFVLIKAGILQWILVPDMIIPQVSEFPEQFSDMIDIALNEQITIGWQSAAQGFFSHQWASLSEAGVLTNNGTKQEGKGAQTMSTISKAVHELSRSLWLARNEVLHGDNSLAMQQIRSEELAEIRELHSHPELLPVGDRHYCEGSLDLLLRKSPSSRRRWLRHLRMVKLRAIQEGTRQLPITDFFRRVNVRTTT